MEGFGVCHTGPAYAGCGQRATASPSSSRTRHLSTARPDLTPAHMAPTLGFHLLPVVGRIPRNKTNTQSAFVQETAWFNDIKQEKPGKGCLDQLGSSAYPCHLWPRQFSQEPH